MTVLDALLNFVPLAVQKALTADDRNVLRHPATAPADVKHGILLHPDAGQPGDVTPPRRVVVVLGPGATFTGIADTLALLYATAAAAGGKAAPTVDELAKALVFYNRGYLPAADWRHHLVGLVLPLPIEIDASGAWIVNVDDVHTWAVDDVHSLGTSFDPMWRPRLTTPPAALDVPDPFTLEADAAATIASFWPAETLAPVLWTQALRNPFQAVLSFLAVLRAPPMDQASKLATALAALDLATADQAALLATTLAGNGILRCLERVLPPPAGADPPRLAHARTLLDDALREGPAGARTLVAQRELPQTPTQQAVRPGKAEPADGAKTDPAGGIHRLVFGRDLAVGRPVSARVAGVTSTGPAFPGRIPLQPYLQADADRLNPVPPDIRKAGLLIVLGGAPNEGLLDAVRVGGPGLLSVGLDHWAAGSPTGLAALLFAFKGLQPDEFDLFFALHGLDVDTDPAHPGQHRLLSIGANGSPSAMDGAALQTFFGGTVGAHGAVTFSSEWAARFRLPALVSTAYRRAQVFQAVDRLDHTADPLTVLAGSFGPFPTTYSLTFDPASSGTLAGFVNDEFYAPGNVIQKIRDTGAKSADTIATALVDLTDHPLTPPYAGLRAEPPALDEPFDEQTFNIGSMAKVAPMYAAHELRFRIQVLVNAVKAAGLAVTQQSQLNVFSAIRRVWSPQICIGFPGLDTRYPGRFPNLGQIIRIDAAGTVTFLKGTATADEVNAVGENKPPTPNMSFFNWMDLMIRCSNNAAAGKVIDVLGYPYINGVLREAGFFHPATKRGIWVSQNYASSRWKRGGDFMTLSPRGEKHYKSTTNFTGTCCELARLLTLAATNRLFEGDVTTCNDMVLMMEKIPGTAPTTTSFIRDRLAQVDHVSSKIGIGVPSPDVPGLQGIHDCAIIDQHVNGHAVRFVAVVIGGYDRGPDNPALREVVRALGRAIGRLHP